MSSDSHHRTAKADKIRRLLDTEGASIAKNTKHLNDERYEAVEQLGDEYEHLRLRAREKKETAIEQLPELIDAVRESVAANGGTVYVADDADDANEYIQSVCEDADANAVAKSKSMTTEEIDVNESLEAAGIDAYETDLGEMVIQVADETPSHLVGPSLHISREEIAELFNDIFDPDEPLETAQELTDFAREYVGECIEKADVGMTGANFVVAESGSIVLVTNEGNARKVVESTNTHIAVSGVEKILPTLGDLEPFVELIGRAGAGQALTAYTSIFTPPVSTPPVPEPDGSDGERDFHLVLIDNGRLEMRNDEHLRETLYCIRCGACGNSCANFQHVGGHAFGGETYTGGIATGWEAGIEGLDVAGEFNDLCTGCSRCVDACPVKIDIPWINTVVRDRVNRTADEPADWLVDGLTPDEEDEGAPLQKRFFGNFETIAKLGSATAPVSNWLADTGPSRWLMERTLGIDSRRALPQFERETLVEWFEKRESTVTDPTRRAVLYPDLYTNHVQIERGKAAVEVLEALGVDVEIPAVPSSGRAPLSQGMVATATDHAQRVTETVAPYIDDGRDVVVIEPSDQAMFDREYEKLVDEDAFTQLSSNSYEVLEYVFGLLENGADSTALRAGDGAAVAYHSHCQQRTLGLEAYTVAVLDDLGYDVTTSDVECCGMAGSFGYKADYYELSMDVGSELQEQFESTENRDRTVVASGTSCLEQIDSLLERHPQHPIQLLDPTAF